MSAICSAVGSRLTCVSQKKVCRPGMISICMAAMVVCPGRVPITARTYLRWSAKLPSVPQSIASASPRRTSIAATSVERVRISSIACARETPWRSMILWYSPQ